MKLMTQVDALKAASLLYDWSMVNTQNNEGGMGVPRCFISIHPHDKCPGGNCGLGHTWELALEDLQFKPEGF